MVNDVEFQCPHCSQWLEAPGDMVSLFVECPGCEAIIKVPSPTEAAAANTAPQEPALKPPPETDELKGTTMRIELPPNLGLPPPPKRQFIIRRPE